MYKHNQKQAKVDLRYVKLTNLLSFKLDIHLRGKWLIHGTKHRNGNHL